MSETWPENQEILERFRQWLEETEQEVRHADEDPAPPFEDSAPADEHSGESDEEPPQTLPLIEAFTALRHELKLQTKGARNLETSLEEALAGLESARQAFQAIPGRQREAAQQAVLPLVTTLIELDEGLARAIRGLKSACRRLNSPERPQASWWSRWFGGRQNDQPAEMQLANEEVSSCLQGFELLYNRLQNNLQDHGIRRIDTPGGLVDPKQMTVIELVTQTEAPPETVVEVIRPGYVLGDRVLRFAEVRAAASRSGTPPHDDTPPPSDMPPDSGSP